MTTNQYNLLLLLAQIELDRLSDQHDAGIQTVKNYGELQSAIQSCEMEEDKPPVRPSHKVILNGEKMYFDVDKMNYEYLIDFLFMSGKIQNKSILYTVSFAHCAGEFHSGTLIPGGHQCHLKDGAVINCTVTNNG